ncbi:MAG TPA: hydrogenase maturation nickel metallochaperone HypA [Pseudonocardiaceae bacterium]|jgi:hydrogenase nickel incorporation protein HypA/HybF|nr:hydrogenase maturation nickel metallochaperone HypA [Pseudonocardiaceae bacterium]
MHELSIAQSIVDAVVERLGEAEVTCVRVEIGRLSGVVADSVLFCFDLVAEGTPVQGARLEISEPGGRGRCRDCGREFDVADPIVLCPGCDSADVDVLSGRDLRIKSVEVKTACAPPAVVATRPESG